MVGPGVRFVKIARRMMKTFPGFFHENSHVRRLRYGSNTTLISLALLLPFTAPAETGAASNQSAIDDRIVMNRVLSPVKWECWAHMARATSTTSLLPAPSGI